MIEKEVESTFVEITAKNGKHIIFGSVYRAPNTNESKLREHIDEIRRKTSIKKGKKELVLGMDHNLYMQKGHKHQRAQAFLRSNTRLRNNTNHNTSYKDHKYNSHFN